MDIDVLCECTLIEERMPTLTRSRAVHHEVYTASDTSRFTEEFCCHGPLLPELLQVCRDAGLK